MSTTPPAAVRQIIQRFFTVAVLAGLLLTAVSCGRSPQRSYNILFIVIDTLRHDTLGYAGHDIVVTPRIDALAAESLVYDRTYAQSSWTKTSVASYLTGIYPQRHQVYLEFGENSVLSQDAVTLPEVLQAAGYRTAAISGNPNVSPAFGFDQGFDAFQLNRKWEANTTDAVAADAVARLDSLATGDPFFLYVHFLDPHDPYARVPGYDQYFSRKAVHNHLVKTGQAAVLSGEPGTAEGEVPKAHELSALEMKHLKGLYMSEISNVDAAVGRILDRLAALELTEDTIVVVTSDHGEEFLEHDLLRHGYHLYDETIRVPLMIKAPAGFGPPARYAHPVELIDVMPTLLDFVGVTADTLNLDGRILAPRGAGAPGPGELAAFGMTRFRKQDLTYLIIGDKKLIHNAGTGQSFLFDLAADPGEMNGRPAKDEPAGRMLLGNMDQLVEALSALSLEGADGEDIDPKLREQLKSLGYIR